MITAALILATAILWLSTLAFVGTSYSEKFTPEEGARILAVGLLLALAGAFTFAALFQVPQ